MQQILPDAETPYQQACVRPTNDLVHSVSLPEATNVASTLAELLTLQEATTYVVHPVSLPEATNTASTSTESLSLQEATANVVTNSTALSSLPESISNISDTLQEATSALTVAGDVTHNSPLREATSNSYRTTD